MGLIFDLFYKLYKWLVVTTLAGLNTFAMAVPCLLCCYFSPKLASRIFARWWAKINVYITPAQVQVHGRENLNARQSYVVVANHLSQFDIFALYGWLDLDLKWVMKAEMRKIPVVGITCKAMGHIFIDRKNREKALLALKEAQSRLVDGTSVLFFPEGTRSESGKLQAFKKGAFVMAKDLELPILPITVIGSNEVLPTNTFDLKPGTIHLVIHPPIPASEVCEQTADYLLNKARMQIATALDVSQVSPVAGAVE